MALATSNCGMTSFGWAMNIFTLCYQKVSRSRYALMLHIRHPVCVFSFICCILKSSISCLISFSFTNFTLCLFCAKGKNLVKIDLMDWDGQRSYAFYDNFRITDEAVRKTLCVAFP